jgi:hypothetical protein
MDEEELQSLYAWIDEVPLSRPKKNLARDFSDAGLSMRLRSMDCARFRTLGRNNARDWELWGSR